MKMTFKLIFLLSLSLAAVIAFDFVKQSFNIVDENADPCDDFYRHACPLDRYLPNLIDYSYQEELSKLKAKQLNSFWQNTLIEKTLENANVDSLPELAQFVTKIFEERCDGEYNTKSLLEHIEYTVLEGAQCRQSQCLTPLANDNNCTRVASILYRRLPYNNYGGSTFREHFSQVNSKIETSKEAISAVSVILDGDLREGVEKVRDLVNEMVIILKEWIEETPWAVNTETVDAIKAEIQQLHVYDNYAIILRDYSDYLARLEQNYLECVGDLGAIGDEHLLCVLFADVKTGPLPAKPNDAFFNDNNAFNFHPELYFSYQFYDMAKNVEEFAGMIGTAGQCVGHEVSHTLIEDANRPELLPFFSNESMHCITSQFQKTCETFKENSCHAGDHQIDENGSDILGNQLAYAIFENHYEGRLQDEYLKLKTRTVTMQQLFFYAYAFSWCDGSRSFDFLGDPHSANNVRANVIAQHPAFQEAFQCSPDSRMMQSVNKECIIFGKNAPQTRRH